MTNTTYTLTDDQIDMIPADIMLRIFGGRDDLRERSHAHGCDASAEATWTDAEGKEWTIRAYGRILGTRLLMWTRTDEAGVDDIMLLEYTDANDDVREYAERIAGDLDCILGVDSPHDLM